MSIDPTIAVLYAQTNYTARLSHDAAVAPQAAGAMSRLIAQEAVRQEQQQVPEVQKGDGSRITGDEDADRHKDLFEGGGERRERDEESLEDDEDGDERFLSDTNKPLVGNLLNVRV